MARQQYSTVGRTRGSGRGSEIRATSGLDTSIASGTDPCGFTLKSYLACAMKANLVAGGSGTGYGGGWGRQILGLLSASGTSIIIPIFILKVLLPLPPPTDRPAIDDLLGRRRRGGSPRAPRSSRQIPSLKREFQQAIRPQHHKGTARKDAATRAK